VPLPITLLELLISSATRFCSLDVNMACGFFKTLQNLPG
jgi:hypothetical protein